MSVPQTSDSIGNLLRLQKLKTVSGRRRVLPGAEFLEDLEPPQENFAGTAPTTQNLPEPERGGELTAQSYDVRANQVNEPEEQKPEESIWTRLGRGLASRMGNLPSPPPIETQQVERQEGLPTENPEEQEMPNNLWARIGRVLKPNMQNETQVPESPIQKEAPFDYKGYVESHPEIFNETAQEPVHKRPGEKLLEYRIPEEVKGQLSERQQLNRAEMDNALANPGQVPVYGATDFFSNSPDLQQKFRTITGIDVSPEELELIQKYENVLTRRDTELDKLQGTNDRLENETAERLDAGKTTTADKYYIGMALLMPLIVGGIFGKEAGLGALGGAAKGLSNVFNNREKTRAQDEEALAALNKERINLELKRGELDIERLSVPQAVKKSLGKEDRSFLTRKREVSWTDPESGERKTGIEIRPGFVVNAADVSSQKEKENLVKSAKDLQEVVKYTSDLNDITNNVIDISSQLKDQNVFQKFLTVPIAGKFPGSLSKLTQEINFNGRKEKAGVALENQLGLLANAYAHANKLGQLDKALQQHIEKIMKNPTTSFQTPKDTILQMEQLKNLALSGLYQRSKADGFDPYILMNEYLKKSNKTYENLNRKEEQPKIQGVTEKLSIKDQNGV